MSSNSCSCRKQKCLDDKIFPETRHVELRCQFCFMKEIEVVILIRFKFGLRNAHLRIYEVDSSL